MGCAAPGEQAAQRVDGCTALTVQDKAVQASLQLLFFSGPSVSFLSIQMLSLDIMAKKGVPGTSNVSRSTLLKPIQPPVLNARDGRASCSR